MDTFRVFFLSFFFLQDDRHNRRDKKYLDNVPFECWMLFRTKFFAFDQRKIEDSLARKIKSRFKAWIRLGFFFLSISFFFFLQDDSRNLRNE